MNDPIVLQSLHAKGIELTTENILQYEAMEVKKRVLDAPPKRMKLKSVKDETTICIKSEFIMTFNTLRGETMEDVATIDLRKSSRVCDIDVFVVLRSLIYESVCYSEDKAKACYILFKLIMLAPGEVLSKEHVYNALTAYTPVSYEESELINAINICLFNTTAPVLYWLNICELTGFYTKALELGRQVIKDNCPTEKDVKKFLNPLYKG